MKQYGCRQADSVCQTITCLYVRKKSQNVVTPCVCTNRRVTTNGFPLRRNAPFGGWVTLATAGFLARRSTHFCSAFPVSQWLNRAIANRIQLRGQPRFQHISCLTLFHIASPFGEPLLRTSIVMRVISSKYCFQCGACQISNM